MGAASDQPLLFHGATLSFQFIFLQLRVSVGSDGHWMSPRHEMDGVIMSALGWQANRSGEDIREFIQEEVQKFMALQRL